jgi:hypothetical protein
LPTARGLAPRGWAHQAQLGSIDDARSSPGRPLIWMLALPPHFMIAGFERDLAVRARNYT